MGKTALMFPGQGSQYVGMAQDLHEAYKWVQKRYATANKILGFDLATVSFTGPPELLVQTKYTQPAIFIHSCTVYDLAAEKGLTPDFCAGHSLGEYSALYAAGVLDFEDALLAVGKRAEFMQQACEQNPGTMAAVFRLDYDIVKEICRAVKGIVEPANHNSPEQIAISGEKAAVEQASALLLENGARRVLPLKVGGAFHSPLMESVPEQLAAVLDTIEFQPAQVPVVPNVTAQPSSDPQELKELLIKQITAPVLWYPTLQTLAEAGVDRFAELGPKTVLGGLVKKSIADVEILGLDSLESIGATLAVATG
ncbi:ACP S-malonyltransferase [Candidatus Zixiibacteriota bacterium]